MCLSITALVVLAVSGFALAAIFSNRVLQAPTAKALDVRVKLLFVSVELKAEFDRPDSMDYGKVAPLPWEGLYGLKVECLGPWIARAAHAVDAYCERRAEVGRAQQDTAVFVLTSEGVVPLTQESLTRAMPTAKLIAIGPWATQLLETILSALNDFEPEDHDSDGY